MIASVIINFNIDTEKAKQAAMRALKQEAVLLKGRSQALCPVDHGTLRDSCVIESDENSVTVGYGGAASSYAAVQHENMSYHHNVGQAKFLEQPAQEMEEEIKEAVLKAIKEAMR
jgi:hypothetical protein